MGAPLMDIEVAGASTPEPVVAVEEDNDIDRETEEKVEVRNTIYLIDMSTGARKLIRAIRSLYILCGEADPIRDGSCICPRNNI